MITDIMIEIVGRARADERNRMPFPKTGYGTTLAVREHSLSPCITQASYRASQALPGVIPE